MDGIDFVAVTITLFDDEMVPICGKEVELTTSRNFWAGGNGWPAEVDEIWMSKKITDQHGQAIFILSTKKPAGTTLMPAVDGRLLHEQRPFCWGEHYNTRADLIASVK